VQFDEDAENKEPSPLRSVVVPETLKRSTNKSTKQASEPASDAASGTNPTGTANGLHGELRLRA